METDFDDGESPGIQDRFGSAIALADFVDSPGFDALDLALGTPGEDVWNGFQDVADAGAAPATVVAVAPVIVATTQSARQRRCRRLPAVLPNLATITDSQHDPVG